jgi:hypothetical protein
MGNKKNERKRIPTAKKLAADSDLPDPADPPRHSSSTTRPKPRPTYKGSTKNSKPSEPLLKKARKSQAVTSESDAMDASDDAGEDEVIEIEVDEDEDEEDEEDDSEEDEEDVKVKGKATTRSAPGM